MSSTHVEKLFNEFLQALIHNWTDDLVYAKESYTDHKFLVETPFFENYAKTFEQEARKSASPTEIIEYFLDLLPYPSFLNGQDRDPNSLKILALQRRIENKFSKAQIFQSTDNNSVHPCVPVVEYVVSAMLKRILASMEEFAPNDEKENLGIYDPNRPRVYHLRLEAPTIDWMTDVVRVNLQNAAKQRRHQSPLLDEYSSRATLELSKLIGIVSTEHSSKVQQLFKRLLDSCKDKQNDSMTEDASVYFTAMRYIHIDEKTQDRWLEFHLSYLKQKNKKTVNEVTEAHLLTLFNVARQMNFVGRDSNKISVMEDLYEIVKKYSSTSAKKQIKKICYSTMLSLLLRGNQSLFDEFDRFLKNRILAHLDEQDKADSALDMLIVALQGTNNPFPFHEKRPINWRTQVRADDKDINKHERMKTIFKALTRPKAMKLLYEKAFWNKYIRVFVHLIAQDLDYAFTHILSVLFDLKKSPPEAIVIGLDALSEIMRTDGEFLKQHQLNDELLEKANRYLPTIFVHTEPLIGISKLGKRISPVLINKELKELPRLQLYEDDGTSFNKVLGVQNEDEDDEKKHLDEEENQMANHPVYSTLTDRQLIEMSFTKNDDYARKYLNWKQKTNNDGTFEDTLKKSKATGKKDYLPVLHACLRCVLAMRPSQVLMDATEDNTTYIGRFLLHPNFETVELTTSILLEIVKQEKMLLSRILTGLTNYLLQFYIHKSSCISIILQSLARLVVAFVETHDLKSVLQKQQVVEDLCIALHRLDAIAFAFLCHTNIYVRYACIELTLAVERGMQNVIAYYFADKAPEQQQRQLAFPSSLGQLFQLYSDEIVLRARKKYENHQDNLSVTQKAYEEYYIEHYDRSADGGSSKGLLRALLDPDNNAPYSSCMDAIVEQIETLCIEGSEYMRFLRVDCCQEILLQPNWLAVDERSNDRAVLGSMCIALIPLIGFSDNGLDDFEFYNSLWVTLWRFATKKFDYQLLNTVLYAVQCAHPMRLLALYQSLKKWFHMNWEVPPEKKAKKKKLKKMKKDNAQRVWVHYHVVLAITTKERLFEVFLDEIQHMQQNQNDNTEYLHKELIRLCQNIDTDFLLENAMGDVSVLRNVARIVDNVAWALEKVHRETKFTWVLHLWKGDDRRKLLETMKIWSQCSMHRGLGQKMISSLFSNRPKHKDKDKDAQLHKQMQEHVKKLEYQSYRAATALLSLGPAIDDDNILPKQVEPDGSNLPPESSWFEWAVIAQKEGIPALKYLMRNHYSLVLKNVLAMLYTEQTRGSFASVKIFFDVIANLDLPQQLNDDDKLNYTQTLNNLIVFCLIHLIPFVPNEIIKNAEKFAVHHRDVSSIITFRGIPTDNYGASYAASLPASMHPRTIFEAVTETAEPGALHIQRPRLLSPAMLYDDKMGKGNNGDLASQAQGKSTVRLIVDIMQALDMSRKAYTLFYKVAQKLGNSKETLDKLHELRIGLQSNDISDVKESALQVSLVFASACPADIAVDITHSILQTLESFLERMDDLEERGLLPAEKQDDQVTIISNLLQISLPWFAVAPLHQIKDGDTFMENLLNLTLRFEGYKKPEINEAFYRIWHTICTSNQTLMSSPESRNIDRAIRFLIRTVIGRYESYRNEVVNVERMEIDARQAQIQKQGKVEKTKTKGGFLSRRNLGDEMDDHKYDGPSLDEIYHIKSSLLKPEQFLSLCESIIRQLFKTHPECVLASLIQMLNVGGGLGGHVLLNSDHIQIPRSPDQPYIDPSFEMGGEDYSLLVTEIAIRWFSGLSTRSFMRIRPTLPVLMVHSLLFLSRTVEVLSNPSAELISHLFVSLLPPRIAVDDEVIQVALWLRDRRTYQFEWSDEYINEIEPHKCESIYYELYEAFENKHIQGYKFDLRRFFAKQNIVYIDDLARILYSCYRIRYGDNEASMWGVRALQWATVQVDPQDDQTLYKARMFAARALRLFAIFSKPKSLRSVVMILKAILIGLHGSQQFWAKEPKATHFMREDMHLSLAIRGIEALISLVSTQEWSRQLFRMMLVSLWIGLSLLHCRVAKIQIAARKLLRVILGHRRWLEYLFGLPKLSDGNNLQTDSASLRMFWSFFKLFEHEFNGIQERLVSSLIFTIGESTPVSLNTDVMMILTCVWLIRSDVLHDRNLSSRMAANVAFFLPYACAVLDSGYFNTGVLYEHTNKSKNKNNSNSGNNSGDNGQSKNGHKRLVSKSKSSRHVAGQFSASGIPALGDDEQDYMQNYADSVDLDDDFEDDLDNNRSLSLRKSVDAANRLRKENAKIFRTLALYMAQNILDDKSNQVSLSDLSGIDFESKEANEKYPLPNWSKIDKNFRSTYVGIHTVVSHISRTLLSSLTLDEPSTVRALGDFCQHLIDLFIPTQAATLASVFSVCLLTGDEHLIIGTIRSLQIFVPRLFKQCKEMNIYNDVIGCFDDTFAHCVHLTSSDNDDVASVAHEFVFELTQSGYKTLNGRSPFMHGMYPAFKVFDPNNDGVLQSIGNLEKILEKSMEILRQYPDDLRADPKLIRLLRMKPGDGVAGAQHGARQGSHGSHPSEMQQIGHRSNKSKSKQSHANLNIMQQQAQSQLSIISDVNNNNNNRSPRERVGSGSSNLNVLQGVNSNPRNSFQAQSLNILSDVDAGDHSPKSKEAENGGIEAPPSNRNNGASKNNNKNGGGNDEEYVSESRRGSVVDGGIKMHRYRQSIVDLPKIAKEPKAAYRFGLSREASKDADDEEAEAKVNAKMEAMMGNNHGKNLSLQISNQNQDKPQSRPDRSNNDDSMNFMPSIVGPMSTMTANNGEGDDDDAPVDVPSGNVGFNIPPMDKGNGNGGANDNNKSDKNEMGNGNVNVNDNDNVVNRGASGSVAQGKQKAEADHVVSDDNDNDEEDDVPIGDLQYFLSTDNARHRAKFWKWVDLRINQEHKYLKFCVDINRFRTIFSNPKNLTPFLLNQSILSTAEQIITKYLVLSQNQDNLQNFCDKIDHMSKAALLRKYLKDSKEGKENLDSPNPPLTKNLFDECEKSVFKHLDVHVFPQFSQSGTYKKLVTNNQIRKP